MPPKTMKIKRRRIAIICGGPSAERGISLNSARSLFDNLDQEKYELTLLYVNPQLKFYQISETEIYSNTPLDFDYKLQKSKKILAKAKLMKLLKKIDFVFPAIHGTYGEDGQLQSFLEKINVPYIGSGPNACRNTANKQLCQQILKKHGFFTVKNFVVKKGARNLPKLLKGRYVAKPLHGGSSIGVQYLSDPRELKLKLSEVFKHENQAIIEPKITGREFTVIVLENGSGDAVALMPTEIELKQDRFFDYRKKYLPTSETRYHTPANFDAKTTEKIRVQAAHAFQCLGMNDFGRLDGWVLPNGTVWFSDVNSISGMEQNSFLFQQAALLGLSHRQLLDYIINKKISKNSPIKAQREEIPVIFGGNTAERQVSVMSGTNVWMKLKSSHKYKPVPLFLSFDQKIFYIPQFLCLQHTVEEIEEKIKLFKNGNFFEALQIQRDRILKELGIKNSEVEEEIFVPRQTSIESLSKDYGFLFLGLHGGAGEDGRFQEMLDRLHLPYNGPGADCSRLCMDKFLTGQRIEQSKIPGVTIAKKYLMPIDEDPEISWKKIKEAKFGPALILKPRGDGCSAGVIAVYNEVQFKKTVKYFRSGNPCIPERTIHEFHGRIEIPQKKLDEILIEDFIVTDKVTLENLKIHWKKKSDFLEITVGFLGKKDKLIVMPPSQTIANLETLSLEEKFMGGTGINLVPPPKIYVKPAVIKKVQQRLKKVGEALGIEGYARIDCFMNRLSGDLIIIEANTLPALTPSTTFFQQASMLTKPLNPRQLLEKIIEIGKNRFKA